MVYMTFKIKRDWLFYVLISLSFLANIISILLLVAGVNQNLGALLAFGVCVTIVFTLINGYTLYNMFQHYKIGLTKDSIRVSDFSRVEIPYNTIRSIKKEREPSKYGLYDALLVIKYNKFDTIKLNVHDLENVFDNLKEMVQKANLDKVVNSVVTKKDGSREIQQNIPTNGEDGMGGATVIIPAASTPTGQTIVNPNATTATVVRSNNQQAAGPMVRPAGQQPVQRDVQANAGPMVRPVTGQPVQRTVTPGAPQQAARPMVRPANANQQVVRTATGQPGSAVGAQPMVRPAATTQVAARTTTTTTTTTTKPADQVAQPSSTQNVVINPDGSKRIITTSTTVKPTE